MQFCTVSRLRAVNAERVNGFYDPRKRHVRSSAFYLSVLLFPFLFGIFSSFFAFFLQDVI